MSGHSKVGVELEDTVRTTELWSGSIRVVARTENLELAGDIQLRRVGIFHHDTFAMHDLSPIGKRKAIFKACCHGSVICE